MRNAGILIAIAASVAAVIITLAHTSQRDSTADAPGGFA